jgi:hypothetical protein
MRADAADNARPRRSYARRGAVERRDLGQLIDGMLTGGFKLVTIARLARDGR